jgi:hypothetical protein
MAYAQLAAALLRRGYVKDAQVYVEHARERLGGGQVKGSVKYKTCLLRAVCDHRLGNETYIREILGADPACFPADFTWAASVDIALARSIVLLGSRKTGMATAMWSEALKCANEWEYAAEYLTAVLCNEVVPFLGSLESARAFLAGLETVLPGAGRLATCLKSAIVQLLSDIDARILRKVQIRSSIEAFLDQAFQRIPEGGRKKVSVQADGIEHIEAVNGMLTDSRFCYDEYLGLNTQEQSLFLSIGQTLLRPMALDLLATNPSKQVAVVTSVGESSCFEEGDPRIFQFIEDCRIKHNAYPFMNIRASSIKAWS